MNKKKLPLAFWIFIGLVVGIAVGLALMMVPNGLDIAKNYILPWGTIFLNLLKFIVVPIVLFSIASGVISMQDIGRVGSVGGKTIVYYMCTTAFAVVLALVLASAAKGMHIFAAMETSGLAYEPPAGQSLMQTIIDIFPSNPITPLANASMLQVIVISLLVGFGILLAGQNMTYMRLKAEVLKDYTLSDGRTPATERDLWQTGRMRDFYRKLNPKLEDEFGKEQRYSTIQKVYKIIVEPKTMNLFARRFGKIDPADVELAVQMMAKLNTVVCDGLLSSTALDRTVYVATRIQAHEDVQKRLEAQKPWGEAQKGSSLDKKIRREFHYDKVQLNDEQKNKMIESIIRQSPEQLAITLQGKEKGCKVIETLYEKRYVDNFLAGSGLTEEQYEQIMQDSDKESADAELMVRLVAEANARMAARDNEAEKAAMLAERQKLDDEIFAEFFAEKERKHPWEKKKERSREMLNCGIPLDEIISQI